MSTLGALLFCLTVGAAVYGFLTAPSWFSSAINRSCLWRLRDRVFDARRTGRLPDTPPVEELIQLIQLFIVVVPEIGPVQLWWIRRRLGWVDDAVAGPVVLDPGPMTAEHHRLFRRFQLELFRVVVRQYLTGSWPALLGVAPRRLSALWSLMRSRPPAVDSEPRPPADGDDHTVGGVPGGDIAARVGRAAPHLPRRRELIDVAG